MRATLTRLLATLALLLALFAGSRALIRALPGDPLETLLAESGTTTPPDSLKEELGLDRPFLPALKQDLIKFSQGDWGHSLFGQRPVAPLIWSRFAKTLQLAVLTLAMGLTTSLALGLAAAHKPRGFINRFCDVLGAVTAALPTPWVGPVLLVVFAVKIPIFPASGHPALPAITLALGFTGLWSRLFRDRVSEVLKRGAAPGARARGISELKVLIKYALVPASGALLAYLGTQIGHLLAGAFVTETLFDWRGMGSLLIEAVLKRDYPVIEAAIFVTAACSFAGTWLGDFLQTFVDPRLRR